MWFLKSNHKRVSLFFHGMIEMLTKIDDQTAIQLHIYYIEYNKVRRRNASNKPTPLLGSSEKAYLKRRSKNRRKKKAITMIRPEGEETYMTPNL